VVEQKPAILIVEDDLDVAEMLNAYFHVQGYHVFIANLGFDAVRICLKERPNIIILDIRLPDIDGYEVAKKLRHDRRTSKIPILFLTEKRSRSDKLKGLELGADDYITKPFDIQELRLRVRNSLQRSKIGSVINPITELPEGSVVDQHIANCLRKRNWAILIINLENLDYFRDAYGFIATDDVLRAVSLMVQNATRSIQEPGVFVGQYRTTAFIVITSADVQNKLEATIKSRMEQSLEYFYPLIARADSADTENRLSISLIKANSNLNSFENVSALKDFLAKKS
jgi:DNA-binding response OmpR family regulator